MGVYSFHRHSNHLHSRQFLAASSVPEVPFFSQSTQPPLEGHNRQSGRAIGFEEDLERSIGFSSDTI